MKKLISFIVVLLPLFAMSQIAGESVYKFVTLPISPRAAALGGSGMAINDGDISLTSENPVLLSKETSGKLSISHVGFVSDIHYGYTNYSQHFDGIGTFGLGIQYFSGGEYRETDNIGTQLGTFGVHEYAFIVSYARNYDSIFSIGASFKPVISQLEQYKSFGLLMDIGASYTTRNGLTTVCALVSNAGTQITSYNNISESVPFSVNLGFSTRLAHAPFRFQIIASNLETPRLYQEQTNDADLRNVAKETTTDEEDKNEVKLADKILTHAIVGVEFLPFKSLSVRVGYNYRRRYELKHSTQPGMLGFSWGVGLKVSRFQLNYANVRYNYSPTGVSHHFGISTRISDFF